MVLEGAWIEGRKVFANISQIHSDGCQSNFGNMFSVLGASAFLPFIPMAPIQILTTICSYDISQCLFPPTRWTKSRLARPRPWNLERSGDSFSALEPISSIFDYTTFLVMLYLFKCSDPSRAPLFQTGWFVESLMTQTLIIHIIRNE